MKDSLGDRIKGYESITKYKLMRRGYTLIRLDGCGFSKYTKGLNRPFDKGLVDDMIETTKYLCKNIQGCKLGYTQSDEITLVLTDFEEYKTQAWFDGELQKICSISASMATAKFNQLRTIRAIKNSLIPMVNSENFTAELVDSLKIAHFDSRVFQVPTLAEVNNTLLWRQRDFIRNSISVCAQSLPDYSHKFLNGKTSNDKQELIYAKGEELKQKLIGAGYGSAPEVNGINVMNPDKANFNWNDLPVNLKRGTTITLQEIEKVTPQGRAMRKVWTPSAFEYSSTTASLLPATDNSVL